jgi:hypothetical protein
VDFARATIDSSKKAVRDTVASLRKQVEKQVQEEILRRASGVQDSTGSPRAGTDSTRKRLESAGKGLIKDLFKRRKTDTTIH